MHGISTPIIYPYILLLKHYLRIIQLNLRDRDNLRTKDKRPVPKVSFVRRFDCKVGRLCVSGRERDEREGGSPAWITCVMTPVSLHPALCCRTFREHCLVFLHTKRLAHRMRILLGLLGLRTSELHGSLTQLQVKEGKKRRERKIRGKGREGKKRRERKIRRNRREEEEGKKDGEGKEEMACWLTGGI